MADGRAGNGGRRKGAGRKRRPAYGPDGDLTPLDYMFGVLRNEEASHALRMDAAKSAAPYCHARLQNIAVDADVVIEALNWDN